MSEAAKSVISDAFVVATPAARSRRHAVTLAALALAALLFGVLLYDGAYLWDEAVYLASAEGIFSAHPYYSELDFRPPLLSVLLAVGSLVIPIDLFARALALAFFSGTVVLLYLFGSRLYGYIEGLSAALLMLLSPFFLASASKVMADIPSTALILGSMYLLFVHTEDEKHSKTWLMPVFAGTLIGGAILMRWVCGLAFLYALALLAVRRLKLRSALLCAAGVVIAMLPYLGWAQIAQGSFVRPFWIAFTIVGQGSEPVPDKLFYLTSSVRVAGLVAMAALAAYVVVLLIGWRKGWVRRELPLILWAVLFAVLLTGLSHKEARYLMPAIPVIFLLAGRGFALLREDWGICLLALLVPVSGIYMALHANYYLDRESWTDALLHYSADTRQAGAYLKDNTRPDVVVYANHLWPLVAYHSKRPTVALWPRDERFYRSYPANMKRDGYFIYYRGVEKLPDQQWLDSRAEFHKVKEFQDVVVYSYKYTGEQAIGPEFQQRLDQARAQFQQGQFDLVIETLSPIRIPDVNVSDLRGWSYYRMGKMEEAGDAFNEGLRADPGNPRCLTGLGFVQLRQGEAQAARDSFQAVVKQVPDKTDALTGLGLALLRLNQRAAAADAFRNVLRQTPDNEEVRDYLKQAEGR